MDVDYTNEKFDMDIVNDTIICVDGYNIFFF